MSEFTEAFTQKFGPLPVWAWGTGAAALVLGVQAYRRSRTPEAPPVAAEGTEGAAPEIDVPAGYSVAPSPMGGGSWAVAPPIGSTAPGGTERPQTNDQWRQLAADYLISKGFTPTLVADALTKWFDGDPLTRAEVAAVNAALAEFKVPPSPPPPIRQLPDPPSGAPAPVRNRPGPVQAVRTVALDGRRVRLSWAAPGNNGGAPITTYLVERSVDGGRKWANLARVASSPLDVYVTPAPAVTYLRISAYNSVGAGPGVAVTTSPKSAPPKPAPPPATPPKPPPATPPKPPAIPADVVVKVRGGDTLWSMTQDRYGRVTVKAVEQVAAHNRLQSRGSGVTRQFVPFAIGQSIKFPAVALIRF